MSLPTLWHFRVSHYNEKARWALDWKGVPHRRQALLPGPHLPRLLWETGQRQVPALRLDDVVIVDSTRIIAVLEERWPDPPLYPADPAARARALALEDWLDEELGPAMRLAFFAQTLEEPSVALATLAVDEAPLTQWIYGLAFPLVRAVMRRDLGITPARAAESRARVTDVLNRLATELQPSGYLVGDAFSVADLTAAALLAPLLRPPEFPYALPPLVPSLAAWRDALAAERASQWVYEMYRCHRGRSAEVAP